MTLIGRLFVIIFALMLSAVAAAMAAVIAWLVSAAQILSADPLAHALFWGAALVGAGVAAFAAFVPMAIGVAVAEAFRIRSALVYALAGAMLMLFGYYSAGLTSSVEESIDQPPAPLSRTGEIAAACGVVFGLTYWAVAGRRAGAWQGRG